MRQNINFIRQFIANPHSVGAVAPSSRHLARALCEPYVRSTGACHVLEVGAGTGAVTRHLGTVLRAEDRLDISELSPVFADALRRDVLTMPCFAEAVAQRRVRLFEGPVQDIIGRQQYDFIVSGLPLTIFTVDQVREILDALRRSLKPGGVFSYFEYIGLRRISGAVMTGSERRRARDVSRFLTQSIATYQFDRRTVLLNLPPAYARHWRFEPSGERDVGGA
ncbi:MAG: methyltransferase domain-containing protein [Phycisphaerales bacterium]|nr:methyltransferase domain-containing protein [Phycisphaerales bacterium]